MYNYNAHMKSIKNWSKVLFACNISKSTTEPHQPWQNDAERRIKEVNKTNNYLMDCKVIPSKLWLVTLIFVCGLLNCCYHEYFTRGEIYIIKIDTKDQLDEYLTKTVNKVTLLKLRRLVLGW